MRRRFAAQDLRRSKGLDGPAGVKVSLRGGVSRQRFGGTSMLRGSLEMRSRIGKGLGACFGRSAGSGKILLGRRGRHSALNGCIDGAAWGATCRPGVRRKRRKSSSRATVGERSASLRAKTGTSASNDSSSEVQPDLHHSSWQENQIRQHFAGPQQWLRASLSQASSSAGGDRASCASAHTRI